MQSEFKHLPVESLQRGLFQPRRHFDEALLHELAASIRSQGLIEPLIVRAIAIGQYEIIAGERRWRAALLACLETVPCLIVPYTDEQAAAVTLIENIQRESLNLLEEAQGYARLIKTFHFSQQDIALLIGKSRSHIANMLRLLSLSPAVQDQLKNGHLGLGHARMLVGLAPAEQARLMQLIINEGWSVRRLEEAIRASKSRITTAAVRDRSITRLESQLAEQLGSPVEISTDESEGGWLKIKFFDPDTLEGLLERMRLAYD